MGAFPNLSRNVPFCPHLSSFVLLGARNGDKTGQNGTNGDKTGYFGTNWETPPFSIQPHLALLKESLDVPNRAIRITDRAIRTASVKDPPVLKIVRRANSLRRDKNATAIAKRYGECSEVLVFLGKRGRKTVQIAKNYGSSKILRNRAPYYF